MKHALLILLVVLTGCSAAPPIERSGEFDPMALARQTISSNNWSESDPAAGRIIDETDTHWDIAFPIPDAIKGGEKPDHRIVRVFKEAKRVKELGMD